MAQWVLGTVMRPPVRGVEGAPLPGYSLSFLAIFTVVAILGFGVFARNPGFIPDWAWARDFYQVSFQFFGRAHAALSALVLAIGLSHRGGRKWVAGAIGVYALALTAEYVGTRFGVPFGSYRYTNLMGYKLAGHVPALIPVSWFVMAVPAYRIAEWAFPDRNALGRTLAATALLVIWDLALDPAMSALTPYWIWETSGPYYGMPLVNLLGWGLTGMLIMVFLSWSGASEWTRDLPVRWTLGFYATVLALPLGMLTVAGKWGAVATTVGAVALMALWFTSVSPVPQRLREAS